jgi:hypothetical protein
MEVNTNLNVDMAQRVAMRPGKPSVPPRATDTASFNGTAALERSVQAAPAVRPEVVARAQELISDAKYPPDATMNGIAILLALKINNSEAA